MPSRACLAAVRLAELQTQYETLQGNATAKGIAPGATFKLKNFPRQDQNREYLITTASCRVLNDTYGSERQADTEEFFSCRLTALNSDTPFRPAGCRWDRYLSRSRSP